MTDITLCTSEGCQKSYKCKRKDFRNINPYNQSFQNFEFFDGYTPTNVLDCKYPVFRCDFFLEKEED